MNSNLSADYWNQRYLKNDFGWDLGTVSPPLKAYIDQLQNKDLFILIPGAGNAYEAEYLVKQGFNNVFVCDMAQAPLNNLQKRCPAIKKENLLLQNFFDLNTTSTPDSNLQFDLIIEQTFFCAIQPSLRKAYAEKMIDLLKPKGKLVGLLFNDALNNDKPPFGGDLEEYKSYFEPLFKMKVFETCNNSIQPRAGRELFINFERYKH